VVLKLLWREKNMNYAKKKFLSMTFSASKKLFQDFPDLLEKVSIPMIFQTV